MRPSKWINAAMRELIDTKPSTMAGALALIDHLAGIGPID
jgi:hypothetical protein